MLADSVPSYGDEHSGSTMGAPDDRLSANLSAEIAKAEAYLWSEMEKLGMRREDGWAITQTTRDGRGGSEIVLRPIHMRLAAPDGLECVVHIVETGTSLGTECRTPEDDEGDSKRRA